MRWCSVRPHGFRIVLRITLLFVIHSQTSAQPASIPGQIVDQHDAAVPGVKITARNPAIGFERVATSDIGGRYQFFALPVGDYTLRVSAAEFKQQLVERLRVEVGPSITQDFQLDAGNISFDKGLQAGLEVLRRLKDHPTIPVIVLTTSTEDQDISEAYTLGCNSYIVKSVEFDKFIDVASKIEVYWGALNMPASL